MHQYAPLLCYYYSAATNITTTTITTSDHQPIAVSFTTQFNQTTQTDFQGWFDQPRESLFNSSEMV